MVMKRKTFRIRLETFASVSGTSPGSVSNFAKCVLAIAEVKPQLLLRSYEELIDDPLLRQAVLL
jgi:hypothetical protein